MATFVKIKNSESSRKKQQNLQAIFYVVEKVVRSGRPLRFSFLHCFFSEFWLLTTGFFL